jgi:hypothetical protein
MKKPKGESPNMRVGDKKSDKNGIFPKQWEEFGVNLTPKGNDEPWGAFLPRPPSERPCMHVKTNECDH